MSSASDTTTSLHMFMQCEVTVPQHKKRVYKCYTYANRMCTFAGAGNLALHKQ